MLRALLGALGLAGLLGIGPCGPLAGGTLSGEVATAPVRDWSFANEVPRCAVEVQPADPHSVTVNCMSRDGRLYVSCSRCEGKRWSAMALADPAGRIRIGERVYPVALRRVVDPAELDAAWKARADKVGGEAGAPRPEGWWTFELTSR